MRKLIMTIAVLLTVGTAMAAPGEGRGDGRGRDPKKMTAIMAEKMNFTAEQNAQLRTLNEKYTGDNYDKLKYRDEFRAIMTEEQRAKADEMRKKRMENKRMKNKD
jgi:hypothetical protein